jgi:hypothetical protein
MDVHQPNPKKYNHFCHDKDDSWCCYHHPILCGATKDSMLEKVENLKLSIAIDLKEICIIKNKFFPNPLTLARTTHKQSIHFIHLNDDDRDQYIGLLIDELVLRGLPPTGKIEEL